MGKYPPVENWDIPPPVAGGQVSDQIAPFHEPQPQNLTGPPPIPEVISGPIGPIGATALPEGFISSIHVVSTGSIGEMGPPSDYIPVGTLGSSIPPEHYTTNEIVT